MGGFHRLVVRVLQIGADPADSSDIALQKRMAVALSLVIVPLAVLWSAVYFAIGAPLSAAIPGSYSIITPVNTAIFALTRNLGFYRFTQLLMFLILPWLLMMSLGGFKESSVVIIWAALCPLGSLLIGDLRQTLFWILGFLFLLIVSAFLQPYLPPFDLPEQFVTWFFVLNIGAVIALGLCYPLVFCWPAELLPGTLRDAAPEHPAEGDFRGAESRTAHHRRPL
jgi:adenylate cyclase